MEPKVAEWLQDWIDHQDDAEEAPITPQQLIRAMANGCPLDTAPDHIWRAYCEAMQMLAKRVLREQFYEG